MIKTKLKFFTEDSGEDEEIISMMIGDSRVQAGEARIEYLEDTAAHIAGLEIKEEFQNEGYGRRFVEYIEKYLKKKGVEKVYLSPATTEAASFWKHLGYSEDEEEQGAMSKEIS